MERLPLSTRPDDARGAEADYGRDGTGRSFVSTIDVLVERGGREVPGLGPEAVAAERLADSPLATAKQEAAFTIDVRGVRPADVLWMGQVASMPPFDDASGHPFASPPILQWPASYGGEEAVELALMDMDSVGQISNSAGRALRMQVIECLQAFTRALRCNSWKVTGLQQQTSRPFLPREITTVTSPESGIEEGEGLGDVDLRTEWRHAPTRQCRWLQGEAEEIAAWVEAIVDNLEMRRTDHRVGGAARVAPYDEAGIHLRHTDEGWELVVGGRIGMIYRCQTDQILDGQGDLQQFELSDDQAFLEEPQGGCWSCQDGHGGSRRKGFLRLGSGSELVGASSSR